MFGGIQVKNNRKKWLHRINIPAPRAGAGGISSNNKVTFKVEVELT